MWRVRGEGRVVMELWMCHGGRNSMSCRGGEKERGREDRRKGGWVDRRVGGRKR